MKKIIICIAFSLAMAAMTSCGKIDKEPIPDRTIPKLVTTLKTTAVTSSDEHILTTTVTAETIKIKKLSSSEDDETNEGAVSKPVQIISANGDSANTSGITSAVNSGNAEESTAVVTTVFESSVRVTTTAEVHDSYPEFSEIEGKWIYQKRISEHQYVSDGYMVIDKDGSFELSTGDGSSRKYGTIKRGKNNYFDGTEYQTYVFQEKNGTLLAEYHFADDADDILFFGENESARLIREDDIADNADFDSLAGEWEYQERDRSSGEYTTLGSLVIEEAGNYTYSPYAVPDERSGRIILRSEKYSDGREKYYYAFCEDGDRGNIWTSCFCEQSDDNVYYTGNGGESRIVRVSEYESCYDIGIIAYHWEYQEVRHENNISHEYVTIGYLDIEADGHYTYSSLDGSENRYGIVRQEYNNEGYPIFAFYDYGQYLWSFCYCEQQDYDKIYMDDNVNMRIRCSERKKSPGECFVGLWENEKTSIRVSKYNDLFVVVISENKDNIVWHYNCGYDEKENMLVCLGEGKKECDITYPYELLEDNCSAKFYFDGEDLIWEDITHNEMKQCYPAESFG